MLEDDEEDQEPDREAVRAASSLTAWYLRKGSPPSPSTMTSGFPPEASVCSAAQQFDSIQQGAQTSVLRSFRGGSVVTGRLRFSNTT